MTKAFKIVVLPGDGIGPDVVAEGVKVLRSVERRFGHRFDLQEHVGGGIARRAGFGRAERAPKT